MSKTPRVVMRKIVLFVVGVGSAIGALLAQTPQGQAARQALPSEQKYAAIEGGHLKSYVNDQTAISRRYRDAGHQFWGRIIGTEADAENAEWLAGKLRNAGLLDVHEQSFNLPPEWMPQSWSVTASWGGKNLELQSAQPTYSTQATPAGGLDLEAAAVGFGMESDLSGRDLHDKAAFFYSTDIMARRAAMSGGAIKRIEERGAAAIFVTVMIPGNLKLQFYPVGSKVPVFALGQEDGLRVRDLIGQARGGTAPRVKVRLDIKMVPNLKTATIWGTLPGMTDENIVIVAHRDGWFEGANDNATGVVTLLGLAEYFATIPKEQRRRTIIFLGTSGHHDIARMSQNWLAGHREIFAKTALLINAEHTAESVMDILRNSSGSSPYGVIGRSDSAATKRWYVGGSPLLKQIASAAFSEFAIPLYSEPDSDAGGEIGPFSRYAPSLVVLGGRVYWHSDRANSVVTHADW